MALTNKEYKVLSNIISSNNKQWQFLINEAKEQQANIAELTKLIKNSTISDSLLEVIDKLVLITEKMDMHNKACACDRCMLILKYKQIRGDDAK